LSVKFRIKKHFQESWILSILSLLCSSYLFYYVISVQEILGTVYFDFNSEIWHGYWLFSPAGSFFPIPRLPGSSGGMSPINSLDTFIYVIFLGTGLIWPVLTSSIILTSYLFSKKIQIADLTKLIQKHPLKMIIEYPKMIYFSPSRLKNKFIDHKWASWKLSFLSLSISLYLLYYSISVQDVIWYVGSENGFMNYWWSRSPGAFFPIPKQPDSSYSPKAMNFIDKLIYGIFLRTGLIWTVFILLAVITFYLFSKRISRSNLTEIVVLRANNLVILTKLKEMTFFSKKTLNLAVVLPICLFLTYYCYRAYQIIDFVVLTSGGLGWRSSATLKFFPFPSEEYIGPFFWVSDSHMVFIDKLIYIFLLQNYLLVIFAFLLWVLFFYGLVDMIAQEINRKTFSQEELILEDYN
jgi:hypothetical protein